MPKPLFFSINLKCPSCRIPQSYIDTELDTVVCDYCAYTFSKKNNLDNALTTNGVTKIRKERLMRSMIK